MEEFEYSQPKVFDFLNKIEISQDSITSTSSFFLRLGKKFGPEITKKLVKDWQTIFTKLYASEKSMMRIQALMYLLNDIVQNSRNKLHNCGSFVNDFKEVLPEIFRNMIKSGPDVGLRKEMLKILGIWFERKVYPTEWIQEFLQGFQQAEVLPENLIPVPNELITFVTSHKELIRFHNKGKEIEKNLQNCFDNLITLDGFDENKVSGEIAEYKRILEIENKYRTNFLRYSSELIKNIDKNHGKMVFQLKTVCKALKEIEELEMNKN